MRKLTILAFAFILCLPIFAQAANVSPVQDTNTYTTVQGAESWSWTLTAANPTGLPLLTKKYSSIEIQVKGTWNTGTVTVYGSENGTNYLHLVGLPLGVPTAIAYSSDPTELLPVWEVPVWVKPTLASGGTDSVVVTLTGRY